MARSMSSCRRHSFQVKLRVSSPSVTTVAHSSPFRKAMTATSGLVVVVLFCVIVCCIMWLSPAKIANFSETPKLFATFLHITALFYRPPATGRGRTPGKGRHCHHGRHHERRHLGVLSIWSSPVTRSPGVHPSPRVLRAARAQRARSV